MNLKIESKLDGGQGGCRVSGYGKVMQTIEPLVLDVRPIFARGGSPCSLIDEAVASLAPGQCFVLVAPFEPAPLFGKLAAQGFSHLSKPMDDGSWRIEFTPGAVPVSVGAAAHSSCSCH